jgi:CheY-like chemotaxis protein
MAGMRIKVVIVAEDEMLIRMAAVSALTDAGFEVIEVEHAEAALSVLEDQAAEVHALFTDVHMPGEMDGLALAHHTSKSWPWIALMIASGKARPAEEALPTGCRFMAKPYDPAHVVRHFHELSASH